MALKVADFIKKVKESTGIKDITRDQKLLSSFTTAGAVKGKKPAAVIRPHSAEEVKSLVELASAENVNLVFFSSPPPRFNGGCIPQSEGVMVDMSKMDKIVRIDRRNKVALIEPGVSYEKLKAEVEKKGMKVLMPLLPRAGKSVIASCLEREPIQIPKYHWDMTDPLLCTELIFGTGDKFRTGSAAGPGTLEQQWAAGGAQKNPLGPAQTDFSRIVQGAQGTMAAVNWATVKLEVLPKVHKLFFITANELSALVDFTYKAMRPKLGDEFFIINNYKAANIAAAAKGGETENISAKLDRYMLVFAVAGYDILPEKRAAYQENDLHEIASSLGLKPVMDTSAFSSEEFRRIIAEPSPEPYYKYAPRGDFLDIFFLTTLDRAEGFIKEMMEAASDHSYDGEKLGIYIQPIQHGRNVHMEFTIYYDSSVKKEKEDTIKFFRDASERLSKAGAFYSRPYGFWSDIAYERCPDTVSALQKVKGILDPDNILNRGKLCFKEVE